MTTRSLKLAKDLSLPLDAATESFAILGRRGSGKTHTAVVMAEEMLKAGVQVVVIDPLDVWWGLRVSKDGKTAGFPIYVAGGSHADIPLSADAGKVLADAVVDQGLSIVLSTRHLSKNDQRRFVGDFCERLYDRKADPQHRTALHVDIDEADAFVPQRLMPGAERCFGAVDTLVRRGRSSGLAVTLISQRPQVINKDVLSQTEVLVSHQLTGPQDRKALQAWIEANDDENRSAEFMGALASLPKGRAWFWSPGLLKVFKPVNVRDRETFDSSATPKPGVVGVKPKAFAEVDLHKLTAEIAATIEKAKADDPRELRKQIATLTREVASLNGRKQEAPKQHTGKVVEKAVLTDADRALLAKIGGQIAAAKDTLALSLDRTVSAAYQKVQSVLDAFALEAREQCAVAQSSFLAKLDSKGFQKILAKLSAVSPEPSPAAVAAFGRRFEAAAHVEPKRPAQIAEGVTKAEQRVLDAVAWWHAANIAEPTRLQVAMVARYTVNGHFNNLVGGLRTKGLVDYPNSGGVLLTEAGRRAANAPDGELTRAELIARVLHVLRTESLQRIFKAVVDAGANLTREELASRTNYTVNGHFNNMVGSLRSLGVIDYPSKGGVTLSDMFDALD